MLSLKSSRMLATKHVEKTSIFYHYIWTAYLLCITYSLSEARTTVEVVRGADVILNCSLTGTFTLPEWNGPPSESIYTNQGDPTLNLAIASVKEKRLEWLSNKRINLILKNVSHNDAGTYACTYTGHGTDIFNLNVTEPVVTTSFIPQNEDIKKAPPFWPALVAIGVWLVMCTLLMYVVWRTSIKRKSRTDPGNVIPDVICSKPMFPVLLFVSCYFVIGWIYIIWCILQATDSRLQTNEDNKSNDTEQEKEKMVLHDVNTGTAEKIKTRPVNAKMLGSAEKRKTDIVNAVETYAARYIQDKKLKDIEERGQIKIYSLQCAKVADVRNKQKHSETFIIGRRRTGGDRGRTILFVGAANTGQCSLIDGIVNYYMGVQFQHRYRLTFFEMFLKNKVINENGWITRYTIHPGKGCRLNYPLHIIDTKGYKKTIAAPEQQEEAFIKQFLSTEKTCEVIDALCLRLNASDQELQNQLDYFNSILELPEIKNRITKICYLITNADCDEPDDTPAGKALTRIKRGLVDTFSFNNAIVLENNIPENSAKWDKFERYIGNFFKFLGGSQAI